MLQRRARVDPLADGLAERETSWHSACANSASRREPPEHDVDEELQADAAAQAAQTPRQAHPRSAPRSRAGCTIRDQPVRKISPLAPGANSGAVRTWSKPMVAAAAEMTRPGRHAGRRASGWK